MIPLGEICCTLSFLPATPSLNADHSVSLSLLMAEWMADLLIG